MTKVVCTIWALLLHLSGNFIFQSCCSSCSSDDDEEPIVMGPRLNSCLFASGVYIITANIPLIPSNFRKPLPSILCLYEFLATYFIIDFSITCVWTSIDVLIMTTLPKAICHTLNRMNYEEAAEWIVLNQLPMMALSFIMSIGFFLTSIHVTKALDLTIYNTCGTIEFADYARAKIWNRISKELTKSNQCNYRDVNDSELRFSRSRSRRRGRRRAHH